MRIRIVSTASGKHAIQVVSKRRDKLTIHQHIGSFVNEPEKKLLFQKALNFIKSKTGQNSLFDSFAGFKLTDVIVSENKPLFLYRLLSTIYDKLGFSQYPDSLIKDLVIARIYSPASKRETREILEDFFNCKYSLKTVYRHLKKSLDLGLKELFQKSLILFAKNDLKDSLRLVFYDVTTLCFDSQIKSGLKDFGFSKDHRSQDAQIVLGLVVNRQGFPLYFDVFNGKTFEGHTFIPVIQNIKKLLDQPKLIVVADAAMISKDNIDKLIEKRIGFVVGARLANLPSKLQEEISNQLSKVDNRIITVSYHSQRLICQYLLKRAAKDKHEREKQLKKAQTVLLSPGIAVRHYRFLKNAGGKYGLNQELLVKAERLEGIKGYLTNTTLKPTAIINRYHDLWRIENAFRLTKTDLEARPIFHHLDETIQAHLVIVLAGLAIARYLEIKTGMSIHKILKLAVKVLTNKITNTKTGEAIYTETVIEDKELKGKIDLLKSLGY